MICYVCSLDSCSRGVLNSVHDPGARLPSACLPITASSGAPERWKLDPAEDPSRRRMKLKRNFKYRHYRGSADDPAPPDEDGRQLRRIDSKLLAGAACACVVQSPHAAKMGEHLHVLLCCSVWR